LGALCDVGALEMRVVVQKRDRSCDEGRPHPTDDASFAHGLDRSCRCSGELCTPTHGWDDFNRADVEWERRRSTTKRRGGAVIFVVVRGILRRSIHAWEVADLVGRRRGASEDLVRKECKLLH
jgi:hypothetical protein